MITKKQRKFKRSKYTQTSQTYAYDVELILEKFGHRFYIFLKSYGFSKFKSYFEKKKGYDKSGADSGML
jgi:hypothetical protein